MDKTEASIKRGRIEVAFVLDIQAEFVARVVAVWANNLIGDGEQ